jgi:hypothetical protein
MTSIAISALISLLFTLGASGEAIASNDLYIPRISAHYRCKFPDGSYTEFKETEQWYFWAEPIPHAQTRGASSSTMKYVDANGNTHPNVGTNNARCEGVGKRGGRLFFPGGFQNLKGQFVHFNEANQIKGVLSPLWQLMPKRIPTGDVDQSPDIRRVMEREFLYAQDSLVIPFGDDQTLLYEQPLTALKHPSVSSRVVLYVYQSLSTDYGKTWSVPVITKEAKLFEIGRLLTEQSWSPKVETLVKHRSVR